MWACQLWVLLTIAAVMYVCRSRIAHYGSLWSCLPACDMMHTMHASALFACLWHNVMTRNNIMNCSLGCTTVSRSHECMFVPLFCLHPRCLFADLCLFSFNLWHGDIFVFLVCVFIHVCHSTGVYYFLHIYLNIAMQAPCQCAANIPLCSQSAIYENKYFVNETTTCSWHHSLHLISTLHPVICRKLQLLQWILLPGHPPRPSCSASTPTQLRPTWQCWRGKYGIQQPQDQNLRVCQCREQISWVSQIQLPVDRHLICKRLWCRNGMLLSLFITMPTTTTWRCLVSTAGPYLSYSIHSCSCYSCCCCSSSSSLTSWSCPCSCCCWHGTIIHQYNTCFS